MALVGMLVLAALLAIPATGFVTSHKHAVVHQLSYLLTLTLAGPLCAAAIPRPAQQQQSAGRRRLQRRKHPLSAASARPFQPAAAVQVFAAQARVVRQVCCKARLQSLHGQCGVVAQASAAAVFRPVSHLSNLKKHNGYWTYEVCYNRHVRQYHIPPPGSAPPSSSMEYYLGQFTEKVVSPLPSIESGKGNSGDNALSTYDEIGTWIEEFDDGNKVSLFVRQRWSDGTVCELTMKPRGIELQFHCSENHPTHISFFSEESTCNYLMIINTPLLCKDTAFIPKTLHRLNAIVCDKFSTPVPSKITLSDQPHDNTVSSIINKPMMSVLEVSEQITGEAIKVKERLPIKIQEIKKSDLDTQDFVDKLKNSPEVVVKIEQGEDIHAIMKQLKSIFGDGLQIEDLGVVTEQKEEKEKKDEDS
ncbi:Protein OS-9 [Nowakowskiella sp. JEL0078]|nr:Protein OS-9 [Nowakowskiella sp. JEL0078]